MNGSHLKILINSFSYKKGIPQDQTGHGAGFVFDMRFVDNPGRRDDMKFLTGLDSEVKTYLENFTIMPSYIGHIKGILKMAIENYLDRGFDVLTINFGCTGGQHRSVYAAETIAEWVEKNFNARVELVHFESSNWKKS